jgi:lysophospholipase L1-like esterase
MSVVVETPYHALKPLPIVQYDKVYVVGDSVSAGIGFKGERTWPEIVADECHAKVTNLSQGGGTSGSAIRQANLIKDKKALVFLEIGGNDMLGRTPLPEYRTDLDHLLDAVKGTERTIVMMEIPWAPFHGAFCRAQREMAGKHGATLVPRRIFAGVLDGKGSTVDGIHLSNRGHEKMAEAFMDICGKMLKVQEPEIPPS